MESAPELVYAVGLSFTVVLLVLDFLSGSQISFALFYLMPIGLVTWNLGRRAGIGTALICTVASLIADLMVPDAEHDLVPYWNALGRFAVFIAFAVLLATLRDTLVAQRERAEREHEVSSGLREMNDVKDTLLHAVSHDLKGPLAGIIGAMSTLRRGNELQLTDDEVESLYQMIEQSGRKMNRLIDDMLDLERLDRGQVQPEREPTDVGEMVRRVAREAPGMDTHPVRIDGEQLLANIDPAKVERIVENLLVNAGATHARRHARPRVGRALERRRHHARDRGRRSRRPRGAEEHAVRPVPPGTDRGRSRRGHRPLARAELRGAARRQREHRRPRGRRRPVRGHASLRGQAARARRRSSPRRLADSGAAAATRTRTGVSPHGPKPCVSTSSTTAARTAAYPVDREPLRRSSE